MKQQLVSSIGFAYVNHCTDHLEVVVFGEVFYMRRTRFLKRLVRKILYTVEVPLEYFSIEDAKAIARRQMNTFVKEYYTNN